MRWLVALLLVLSGPSMGLAQGKKGGGEKPNIDGEGKVHRSGDKTSVDFDEAEISGARHVPMGSMINENKVNKDYNLVRIRHDWHEEIQNSTNSLETQPGGK